MKLCGKCQTLKSETGFYKCARARDGLQSACKPCQDKRKRQWNEANRDRVNAAMRERLRNNPEAIRAIRKRWYVKNEREAWLKQRYGITLAEFRSIVAAQGGGCAICGRTEEEEGKRLSVDHDHVTGKVRGVLCDQCNRGIGTFKDQSERLRRAADYLDA